MQGNILQDHIPFLVIYATLESDNPLSFRKILLKRKEKLIMTIEEKIRDESLYYDINRGAVRISAWSSEKIDKYKFSTGEEILPHDERGMIEQTKLAYSTLGKAFEKQTKTIKDQEKK